jgi:hypothetical protein
LNYQERMRTITAHLNAFLAEWKRPDHLEPETALRKMRAMAEAINKRLPASCVNDSLAIACDDIFQDVAESHRGREWPDVSLFAKAAGTKGEAAARAMPTTETRDTVDTNLERLRSGAPLGDEWFFGRRAVELLGRGATEADLDAYRSGLFFGAREIYGVEEAQRMELAARRKHDDALELAGRGRHFGTVREHVA